MRETILSAVLTCLTTLTITFIFNWVINGPKRKRDEDKKRREEENKRFADFEERINKRFDEANHLRVSERKAYKDDHFKVMSNLEQIQAENKLQMEGLQSVIKHDLKVRYLKWIKLGYAPMDAKDDLERMYQVYHRLGANGVMDKLREQFLALPETSSTREGTKTSEEIELEISDEDL